MFLNIVAVSVGSNPIDFSFFGVHWAKQRIRLCAGIAAHRRTARTAQHNDICIVARHNLGQNLEKSRLLQSDLSSFTGTGTVASVRLRRFNSAARPSDKESKILTVYILANYAPNCEIVPRKWK